jgi:predicted N-acetyltransferase YhbS
MLKIHPLYEKKSLYPILAYWSYNNWYIQRDVSFRLVLHDYKRRAAIDPLPLSLVAMWEDLPVGMVSIKDIDMAKREELSPWLSALFVSPDYRKKGIGGKLISSVLSIASSMGYERIFLFIDCRFMNELEKFYKNRGWIFYDEETDSDGNMTKILFHEL